MGKVLLAFSPVDVVDSFLSRRLRAFTPHTITDSDRFRWVLKLARAHRLAVSDRELQLNHVALAAPVFGVGGHVVASLEVMVDDSSVDLSVARPALIVAAGSLSRELERPCCECRVDHGGFPDGVTAARWLGTRPVVLVTPGEHQTDAVLQEIHQRPAAHRGR